MEKPQFAIHSFDRLVTYGGTITFEILEIPGVGPTASLDVDSGGSVVRLELTRTNLRPILELIAEVDLKLEELERAPTIGEGTAEPDLHPAIGAFARSSRFAEVIFALTRSGVEFMIYAKRLPAGTEPGDVVLDISNIQIEPRSQGTFTKIVRELEECLPPSFVAVQFSAVTNRRLMAWLERNGYARQDHGEYRRELDPRRGAP